MLFCFWQHLNQSVPNLSLAPSASASVLISLCVGKRTQNYVSVIKFWSFQKTACFMRFLPTQMHERHFSNSSHRIQRVFSARAVAGRIPVHNELKTPSRLALRVSFWIERFQQAAWLLVFVNCVQNVPKSSARILDARQMSFFTLCFDARPEPCVLECFVLEHFQMRTCTLQFLSKQKRQRNVS